MARIIEVIDYDPAWITAFGRFAITCVLIAVRRLPMERWSDASLPNIVSTILGMQSV